MEKKIKKLSPYNKKQIRRVSTPLRKYAHSSVCVKILECPQNHPACNRKLALDTAIAWRAAQDLESFRYNNLCQATMIWIETVLVKYRGIISLHSVKYEELLDLLNNALYSIHRINARQNREK